MAIVTEDDYYNVYMGSECDPQDFPAMEAHAADVISSMTRWKATEDTIASLPPFQRTLVKKAVCAQIDFFAINGFDSVSTGGGANGFTVGKVSVGGRNASESKGGAMSGHISPMALQYLEQSGLMNPQVATMPEAPWGWV